MLVLKFIISVIIYCSSMSEPKPEKSGFVEIFFPEQLVRRSVVSNEKVEK